jgi:hypothetical protein
MLSHKDLDAYSGCLLYGNDWRRDHGNFLSHTTDQSKIDAENKDTNCKGSIVTGANNDGDSTKQAVLAWRSGIETNVDVLLPKNTMTDVVVNVSMSLYPNDSNKYIHTIKLSANPCRESKLVFSEHIS